MDQGGVDAPTHLSVCFYFCTGGEGAGGRVAAWTCHLTTRARSGCSGVLFWENTYAPCAGVRACMKSEFWRCDTWRGKLEVRVWGGREVRRGSKRRTRQSGRLEKDTESSCWTLNDSRTSCSQTRQNKTLPICRGYVTKSVCSVCSQMVYFFSLWLKETNRTGQQEQES